MKRGMALPEGVEPKPIQPIIETVSETLALEVKKTFDFYRTTAQESEAAIQKILLAGGGSKLPGLPDFLANVLIFRSRCSIRSGRLKLMRRSLIRTTCER